MVRTQLEIADALVAAAARTAGLHGWTLNLKHYPMDDVRLYQPAPAGAPRDR
jgi:hypothetical protein